MSDRGSVIVKVNRTEQHVIRKSNPLWKVIDVNCFYSKNLYNYANYHIRQEFINNGKWIRYNQLDKMLHDSDPYKELKSQPAQQTLSALDKVWKSFFVAIKDWKKNPTKYLGMPRLPKYLKKAGRYLWFIKNNICYIKDGVLHFQVKRLSGITFPTKAQGRLIQVRFVPRGSCYVMEIITEVEILEQPTQSKNIASIDLGIDNFATVTNNIGLQPIAIKGGYIKSVNQYYNKRKAVIDSEIMKKNGKRWCKRLGDMNYKRYNKIKTWMHKASKYIVEYCMNNKIDTLVCGYNAGWKQECDMGKVNNQKFVSIPYKTFVNQLAYKCENNGIRFITTEESYTSGTSFLDGEVPCKENYDKSRRIKRGLFQTIDSLINSDVNGSYQIMRKAFPNAISLGGYGIEGCGLSPVAIRL